MDQEEKAAWEAQFRTGVRNCLSGKGEIGKFFFDACSDIPESGYQHEDWVSKLTDIMVEEVKDHSTDLEIDLNAVKTCMEGAGYIHTATNRMEGFADRIGEALEELYSIETQIYNLFETERETRGEKLAGTLISCEACGHNYSSDEYDSCPECGHNNKDTREAAGEDVDDD